MTATRQFAASVGDRVGIGEETILAIILALIQAAPMFCPRMGPRRLRKYALRHPDAVREQTRLACGGHGIDSVRADAIANVFIDEMETMPIEQVATMLKEIKSGR